MMDFGELLLLVVLLCVVNGFIAVWQYRRGYREGSTNIEDLEKQNEYLHAINEQMKQALIKEKIKTEEDFFEIDESEVPDDRANGDYKGSG